MDLQQLKGIGNKTIEYLYQSGIYNIEDLITYYPYRYQVLEPDSLENTNKEITITINATVSETGKVSYIKRNFNLLRFKVMAYGKIIPVSIFNRAYLNKNLTMGKEITLIGKYDSYKNSFTASDIKLSRLEGTRIIPVYHYIKGIKNSNLEKLMMEGLQEQEIKDNIPEEYNDKYHFISMDKAIHDIHHPSSLQDIEDARNKLIYSELFTFMFKIQFLAALKEKEQGITKNIPLTKIDAFISSLPFQLTNDQNLAIHEGLNDMMTNKRMNRLLIGDVGSGKTIVASTLMYANFLAGFQSAFLVPTEILAVQHFHSLTKLFKDTPVTIDLLVGSMTKKEKKNVLERIKKGNIDILIGTHAILNEELEFANLGFVTTDEQHRFGVEQREFLSNRGDKPDMLFMSATPIPRTYALTIYGDMDTSEIKEKPVGRKDIMTKVVKEQDLKEVLLKIIDEIKQNHQIYVVAPLIEENEEQDLKDIYLLKEKFDLAFHNKIPIGVLHGKLKKSEKASVMDDFKNGHTKILISTTVIEVGVDVPNATMMIIFNAERFGLATLHQLRGRVGRNEIQSYCYLICNQDIERLRVLEESNDGFYISEQDFKLRGSGDLFGLRQSGDMNFKIANLRRDFPILLDVKEDVSGYIHNESYLNSVYYLNIIKEINFTN